MAKTRSTNSTRKPPEPMDDHAQIEEWMARVMPALQPVVESLDATIREAIPGAQYAIKWRKAYYGLPDQGWIIELVAYDVSVNVVFLGGAELGSPPPDGEGDSRYVKVRTVDEANAPELKEWIQEAATLPGWK